MKTVLLLVLAAAFGSVVVVGETSDTLRPQEPITPLPLPTDFPTPLPATFGPQTPDPVTPDPITTGPPTPETTTPEPTPDPSTPPLPTHVPMPSDFPTPLPTAIGPRTPDPVTPDPITIEPTTPKPIPPEPTTPEPEPTTPQPTTPAPEPTSPVPTTVPPPSMCPALQSDTLFVASDRSTEETDLESCCAHCAANPRCVAFSYWPNVSTCWLHYSTIYRVSFPGAFSGYMPTPAPTTPAPPTPAPTTPAPTTPAPTTSAPTTPAPTTPAPTTITPTTPPPTTTKPPTPAPTPPTTCTAWETGIYQGTTTSPYFTGDYDSCCQQCSTRRGCIAFTYNTTATTANCMFHYGTITSTLANAQFKSARVRRPLQCSYKANTTIINGNPINLYGANTVTECCGICSYHERCRGYAFYPDSKNCLIFSGAPQTRSTTGNIVSGLM